jgi:alpha-ketoglutarate-dependent taurine dioxygenase
MRLQLIVRIWRPRRHCLNSAIRFRRFLLKWADRQFPYTPELSLGSLLHALELPTEGGDTSFTNLSAAYDALPAEIKQRVEGKRAVHSYRHSYERFSGSKWRPPLTQNQKDEVRELRTSCRTHPSGNRPQGAVREQGLHISYSRPP